MEMKPGDKVFMLKTTSGEFEAVVVQDQPKRGTCIIAIPGDDVPFGVSRILLRPKEEG